MADQSSEMERSQPSEIEQALRAIVPSVSASPAHLMEAVVQHTIEVGKTVPHRRRRRGVRRHGAHVRLRELEQSRQYNLQLDLMDLQRQIAQLTQLREMLYARTFNRCDYSDGSFVRTAIVYYDIAVYEDSPAKLRHANEYLAAVMDEDVRIGRIAGRQHVLPILKQYADCFHNNRLEIKDARVITCPDHNVSDVVVRTTADFFFGITMRTIEMLFPHVTSHDRLVQQLVGKSLVGESTFDFTFDGASGRVVRGEAEFYCLCAFLRLVPDPTQLAFLFSRAKISEEMLLGETEEFDADAPAPIPILTVASSDLMDDPTNSGDSASPLSGASDSERGDKPHSSVPPSRRLRMADLLCDDDDHGVTHL